MKTAPLPRWAEIGLIPVLNIALALGVSGLVIAVIGENPLAALTVMLKGPPWFTLVTPSTSAV